MSEKILLVDDDPNILDGYRRSLGREFVIETAMGGEQALQVLANGEPHAVVVSDMRMPGMDGIELLTRVKALSSDTIRIMLTGNADIETAIDAINEGNIFRFLTKPCDKELMSKTLNAALLQYRLVTAEKQLLEQTLRGSVQVLTEVLSLVNPAAFSRAERARRYIHHIVTAMNLENPWQYEVAAMMSQLGCVTLPPETVEAVFSGRELSATDQAQYDAHPRVAHDLLSKIPRLEAIAWVIDHQNCPLLEPQPGEFATAEMRRGAEILRTVLAYEKLIRRGSSRTEAAHSLRRQNPNLSPAFFEALVSLDPNAEDTGIQKCRIEMLSSGMIIQQEVRTEGGTLLVSKGQEVTPALLLKLKNFHARHAITGDLLVSAAQPTSGRGEGAFKRLLGLARGSTGR